MNREELLKIAKPLIVNKEIAKLLPQKTMTRRIIKQDFSCPCKDCNGAYIDAYNHGKNWYWWNKDNKLCLDKVVKAQYNIGDILWIREPVKVVDFAGIGNYGGSWSDEENIAYEYVSDGFYVPSFTLPDRYKKIPKWVLECKNVPNGCLKEMARYFVKIINIKVERLQDITIEDTIKEGLIFNNLKDLIKEKMIRPHIKLSSLKLKTVEKAQKNDFIELWNNTASKGYKWEDNPFVFVYEWKYLEGI